MTNFDYYIKSIGIAKNGKVINCARCDCSSCIFNNAERCNDNYKKEWFLSEHQPTIDWSKVKNNTLIYVKDTKKEAWLPRHFAKYEDGHVFAWYDGKTSFTTSLPVLWKYATLPEIKKSKLDW
mgnify:CR=1 FL=1